MTHLLEKDTNAMIRHTLEILKARGNLYFSRMQSGNLFMPGYPDGKYHRVEVCQAGTADWLVIQTGHEHIGGSDYAIYYKVIWLEAKSLRGHQSPNQRLFEAWVTLDLDHEYYIIRSYEDMEKVFGAL